MDESWPTAREIGKMLGIKFKVAPKYRIKWTNGTASLIPLNDSAKTVLAQTFVLGYEANSSKE